MLISHLDQETYCRSLTCVCVEWGLPQTLDRQLRTTTATDAGGLHATGKCLWNFAAICVQLVFSMLHVGPAIPVSCRLGRELFTTQCLGAALGTGRMELCKNAFVRSILYYCMYHSCCGDYTLYQLLWSFVYHGATAFWGDVWRLISAYAITLLKLYLLQFLWYELKVHAEQLAYVFHGKLDRYWKCKFVFICDDEHMPTTWHAFTTTCTAANTALAR